MPARYYRMFDPEPNGVQEIRFSEAEQWNRKGFGIFWTVNSFDGPRRIERLTSIDHWAIDMDAGTKAEQRERLSRSPIVPHLIVETKRGYQAYWRASEATAENWNAIMLERLVPFFGADANARDLARILRVPGFLHLKDPANPFRVRYVHQMPGRVTERQMLAVFPVPKEEQEKKAEHKRTQREIGASDSFWDAIYNLDCEEGLRRLEGSLGETYKFKATSNGKKNIIVNGKSSPCWIDAGGRIGSPSKGGPTLIQWVKWFGHSTRDAVEMVKRAFPELERYERRR